MTPHLISIYALVAMFVIATIWPINMGVLAFVGAFLVGIALEDVRLTSVYKPNPIRMASGIAKTPNPKKSSPNQKIEGFSIREYFFSKKLSISDGFPGHNKRGTGSEARNDSV